AFAQIEERLVPADDGSNEIDLILDIIEGQRVTVSRVDFIGNEGMSEDDLYGAMSTKSEGFWWFRSGDFEATQLQIDLQEKLPQFYGSRGYLDFRVLSDTVIVDPSTGKSIVQIEVEEGEQYRLGSFRVNGNTQFTTEELEVHFREAGGGILSSLGFGGEDSGGVEGQVFDAAKFNEAVLMAEEQYRNEGYLYIQINPVIDRKSGTNGEGPTVDTVWEVIEGAPALVNRIAIMGNEYTYEWVIRNQIFILPGDVYSQSRVLRSYQNISSLGFFEAPMPFPDIQPNEDGDVDITFNVVEKQTGSINFGTSMGGGYGLSGFIGYQQPNLFGQAKSGSIRWDFGRFLNSFEASYTDPALFQSLMSGSLSLFNSRDRFFQFSTGRRVRLGASTRVGFPWPNSRVSRVFLGYSISRTEYELFTDVEDTSLFGRPPGLQSQLSLTVTRQTLDHPLFPTIGSRQNVVVEFNGGLLGGNGDFTKMLTEANWWLPIGQIADGEGSNQGPRFALGLTLRAGSVFGDAGAFPFDRFWMGGVQFGQNLRGYDETSITPEGFFPEGRTAGITEIERLGDAFFSLTAEYALRMSDQFGVSLFYDAGNVWREPSDIDPTRLFRGAGVSVTVITPFGPIGLDYAYGFDKTEPGWQLHFRMGQGSGF
ncbi:MAG: outer membrane protein assembly factor BamA, partial [Gemmatimonadetes bacterium]|nr:outer membrane protein assembly factor BamA [Gemmatimonadota bacterium]